MIAKLLLFSLTILIMVVLCIAVSRFHCSHVCRLAQESHERIQRFLRVTFAALLTVVIVVAVGGYSFADEIIRLVAGIAQPEAVDVLRLMSVVPLLICLNFHLTKRY